MVDFGQATAERNLRTLLLDKLRPGDVYTHCFSGLRGEFLPDKTMNPVMLAARKTRHSVRCRTWRRELLLEHDHRGDQT